MKPAFYDLFLSAQPYYISSFEDCPGRGTNLGSFAFHLFSLISSALEHSATAPLFFLLGLISC